jgi:putative endonuclease
VSVRRESAAPARRTARQLAGDDAEERAARHLSEHGLTIVARNWRTRLGEIDLVAREGGTLVFVEVRKRASASFGGAAASIDARKRSRIEAAAGLFLARLAQEPPCRFDVVAIEEDRVQWLRGAFEATRD